jgi:hypothetical protein
MPATRTHPAAGRVAAVLIGILLLSGGGGCGRKMPPIQPGLLPPPTVADLTYEMRGNEIILLWTLPAFSQKKESAAAGFQVLRARQTTAEAQCRECPAPFETVGDVLASGRAVGSRLRFRDAMEPGFTHSYKLKPYTADGVIGQDSNTVVAVF